MNVIKDLQNVITDLCDMADLLENNQISAAFSLGSIVCRIEYIKEKLEQSGNGDV